MAHLENIRKISYEFCTWYVRARMFNFLVTISYIKPSMWYFPTPHNLKRKSVKGTLRYKWHPYTDNNHGLLGTSLLICYISYSLTSLIISSIRIATNPIWVCTICHVIQIYDFSHNKSIMSGLVLSSLVHTSQNSNPTPLSPTDI